jgi:hypothetical protein
MKTALRVLSAARRAAAQPYKSDEGLLLPLQRVIAYFAGESVSRHLRSQELHRIGAG